jgi:phosphoribosylformimino-5-aminoimidazole carboxamide ribotide isomerase
MNRSVEAGSGAGVERFAVIPAVDIHGDTVVRLSRGNFERVTIRAGDPREVVRRFAASNPPFIHIVDLDAARSGRPRPHLIAELADIATPVEVQAAGGIRSKADAERLLEAGAARIVVGTAAFAGCEALHELATAFGERLAVAMDVGAGIIRVKGWTETGGLSVHTALRLCRRAGVKRIVCTAIERDGTLTGPDLDLQRLVTLGAGCPVLAAGGIRSKSDLDALASIGLEGAVVGRALFEDGDLSLGNVSDLEDPYV